jgi:stage II sporulation protein GA (sporulation sigma-E factor processing peptidase)
METGVYVDVLLVLNYIINMLLLMCAAKLAGRSPARRRIVAAALFGSVSSLTIFLPSMGFAVEFLARLAISGGIILIAFRWMSAKTFFKELFLFFAVSFFFAGIMLGLWLLLKPNGMLFYNGIVYFDISFISLIVATVAAYAVLSLFHRFSRNGRIKPDIYRVFVYLGNTVVALNGLVDSGNALCEPFSGLPVMVCGLEDVESLLPDGAVRAIRSENYTNIEGKAPFFRAIPYSDVSGSGVIPAFRPDRIELHTKRGKKVVESVYIGVTRHPVGNDSYEAILNPDITAFEAYPDRV